MIIGQIDKDEKAVRFNIDLRCTDCKKMVPGGIKASEKFYGTEAFRVELELFEKNYLCGICRDKKRVKKIDFSDT